MQLLKVHKNNFKQKWNLEGISSFKIMTLQFYGKLVPILVQMVHRFLGQSKVYHRIIGEQNSFPRIFRARNIKDEW